MPYIPDGRGDRPQGVLWGVPGHFLCIPSMHTLLFAGPELADAWGRLFASDVLPKSWGTPYAMPLKEGETQQSMKIFC